MIEKFFILIKKPVSLEMDNRGSKLIAVGFYRSEICKSVIVKEQRVDNSQCTTKMHLRITLMAFERNYPVRILSKQIFKNQQLYFSAKSDQLIVDGNSQSAPLKPFFLCSAAGWIHRR